MSGKENDDDVPRTQRTSGSSAPSPGDDYCTIEADRASTPFFYSHLTQHATLLITGGFNTHSAALGPRFSTTDF